MIGLITLTSIVFAIGLGLAVFAVMEELSHD